MIKNFIIIASVTANFSFLVYFYKNFNDDVSTYSKPELSPASTMSTTLLSENNVIQTPSAIVPDSKIAAADTVALPEIWKVKTMQAWLICYDRNPTLRTSSGKSF